MIPAPTQDQIRDAIRAAQTYAAGNGVTSVQDMSARPTFCALTKPCCGMANLRSHLRTAATHFLAAFGGRWHACRVRKRVPSDRRSERICRWLARLDHGALVRALSRFAEDQRHCKRGTVRPGAGCGATSNMRMPPGCRLPFTLSAIRRTIRFSVSTSAWNASMASRDRRLRIEHAQHLVSPIFPRFASDHVIASMQPYHCIDDGRWAEKRIGPERAKTTYAFRSLLDTGATLAFGSDWDVAPMAPLMGIYAAVTRRTLDGKHPGRLGARAEDHALPKRYAPIRWARRTPVSKKTSKDRSSRASWPTWSCSRTISSRSIQ